MTPSKASDRFTLEDILATDTASYATGPLPCGNWSPTRLVDWLMCPARGAWSTGVFDLPDDFEWPSRPDAAIGKAVHRFVESRLQGADREEAALAAADEAVGVDPESWLPLTDLWDSAIRPAIGTPQATEQRLEADIDGIPVTCVIDVIDEQGQIRDLKTTKRTPNGTDVIRKSLQAPLYVLAWAQKTGETAPFALDYLIRTKTPQTLTIPVPVTEQSIDRVRQQLAWAQEQADDPDRIVPNPYSAYGCSGCPFVAVCADRFGFPTLA
ncbi:PD-(D/E)XK nuclease superfamily protein [Sulfobacillus thermosulfidooxidans DSM 9293]|uniref:PD-(D/E)XK nuclease superfamily protein n=2 Tax=Sulfobacillus thermosulfidooxidans TaxID=28034 RepID=A0A1W1W7N9_SULTA|nr:PD-(D/E)XK nuclease family protein [Sulfobacillus thermosulfidooxidans]SMC02070.1 PD-(D/E)XK nuclease superfamily protein [Sulfobacillus thermosulfidooxidans DSM 9293]